MLSKLKKYKYILLLLLALFFLPVKSVNADSSSIEYNSDNINVSYFNSHHNAFLMYDNNSNTYLSFALFRTSNGEGSNPRFYVVKEDENYIYISGRSNQYFYNCTAVCNYNISTGTTGSVVSSVNYAGSTSDSNSNNGSYKIDKNRYSFVYKGDNTKIYTDETCSVENTESSFFFGIKEISPFHVEYREDSQSFYVVTDFMDFKTCMYTYTGYYNTKGLQTAFYPDTYENYNWTLMDKECSSYENEDGTNDWRYAQEILSYGEYYFCLRNHDTKTHEIYCIKITGNSSSIKKYNEDTLKFDEIEKTDYEQKNYLPSDNTSAENQNFYVKYDNNVATIYSNYLAEDDVYKYDCLFSKDYINYSDDITKEYSDSKIEGYSSYCRFVKDIYENGTYYFRLRKIEKRSGSIISANVYTVVVDGISVNVIGDENTTIDFYKNTNTMQYFRKTLGIVFYPVEMMFDFFNRLENIQTQEPVITVPDIKEPFTDTVFIKGFTFSLNDVLENENIAYVYNIYLYFTDFILYSLLFVFFMKIFKTYAHFDGGVS